MLNAALEMRIIFGTTHWTSVVTLQPTSCIILRILEETHPHLSLCVGPPLRLGFSAH